MKDILIAAYQMDITPGKKELNLKKVQKTVELYSRPEIDLWVLPELFSTGFAYSRYPSIAESLDDSQTLLLLEKMSRENSTWFSGSILVHSLKQGFYQNVGFFISPTKGVVSLYPKIHLWVPERGIFIAGSKLVPPVDLDGKAKIGLSICYDLRFPEVARNLVLKGAEVLITPSAWPVPRINHFKLLAKARSLENTCYHIALNRLGTEQEPVTTHYSGFSCVCDPWGEIISGAGPFEQVIQTHLQADILKQTRELLPVLRDRQTDYLL